MTPRTLIALYKIANTPALNAAQQGDDADPQPDQQLAEAEAKGKGPTENANQQPAQRTSAEVDASQKQEAMKRQGEASAHEIKDKWYKQVAQMMKLSNNFWNKMLKWSGRTKQVQGKS